MSKLALEERDTVYDQLRTVRSKLILIVFYAVNESDSLLADSYLDRLKAGEKVTDEMLSFVMETPIHRNK